MKKPLKYITNKYTITLVLFLLLMLFFDQNDWFTQHAREKELGKVQQTIDHVNSENSRMERELKDLNASNSSLEQYARKRYHERRDGEDVYIIVPDSVKPKK